MDGERKNEKDTPRKRIEKTSYENGGGLKYIFEITVHSAINSLFLNENVIYSNIKYNVILLVCLFVCLFLSFYT